MAPASMTTTPRRPAAFGGRDLPAVRGLHARLCGSGPPAPEVCSGEPCRDAGALAQMRVRTGDRDAAIPGPWLLLSPLLSFRKPFPPRGDSSKIPHCGLPLEAGMGVWVEF